MRFNPVPVLFIAAPLAEIVTFGLVVEWLGFWWALALVFLTSAIGFLIVRQQGFGLVSKVTAMAREGRAPTGSVGADLMTMLAGLLLLIPGFLTDILGLLLLLPFVRNRIAKMPGTRTRVYAAGTYTEHYDFGPSREGPAEDQVVDLDSDDYRRMDGKDAKDGQDRLPGR